MQVALRSVPLRRKLSFFLLLSLLNALAAPLLTAAVRRQPASSSNVEPVSAPDTPTEFIRQISLPTNDLVFSTTTGKLYASVPSSAGAGGNSIATIDPSTGAITNSTFIGSEPNKLALSDDGHSLYAGLDGAGAIRRFDVVTQTFGLQFSLGDNPIAGRYRALDIAVAPGNPDSLAVSRARMSGFATDTHVAMFDNGLQRPNIGFEQIGGIYLAFSAAASKLYASGTFTGGLRTLTIDAAGVAATSPTSFGSGGQIKFSNGLIFSSKGQVINPDSETLLGTFPGVANSQAVVPDPTAGRAYYLVYESSGSGSTLVLKAFDINTFLSVGSMPIPAASGGVTSLVRWGANGLAFRTTSNQLFIIQTSLIPSAEPIPTPTPTPSSSPTPSPVPSPQPAFIRRIDLTTNDLVYNQNTQKLYASVPSSAGSSGNSVAELDPELGTISSSVYIGSEPTKLAQSDDGQTLYVGLDGASSVRSYDMLSHTAGLQFSLGLDSLAGPYSLSDLAVAPGNSQRVAVARRYRNTSPSQAGVAVFDNGVQGTQTEPIQSSGSNLLAFGSGSTLYGVGPGGLGVGTSSLKTMMVDASGVTVTGTATFNGGANIRLDNNLLYGASGEVINPATGLLVGSFVSSDIANSGGIVTTDSANGRVYFLVPQAGILRLTAFDINTFLPLGFVHISGTSGSATTLVRWGTNGLAFRTSDGKVFLVKTSLVSSAEPIASPTPTPSPSPSPSPSYIPTFVRRVNLPANSLAYSSSTQALYASVPGTSISNGNSITRINPETGEFGPSTFVGSEPNKMAMSTDGQTLSVHLDGANAVRRFDVPSQTPGSQFPTFAQPPFELEVVPGSPNSLAVSRSIPNGVSIFDNGVERPSLGGGPFYSVQSIEFGATPTTLYGFDSSQSKLVKFLVDGSGVTFVSSTSNLLTGGNGLLKFSNGLLYSGSGRVVDPETKRMIGTFVAPGSSTGMAVDPTSNRVFYVSSTGNSSVVLTAFDGATFLRLGSVTIPGVPHSPVNLVRWGINGLAFNTVPHSDSNSAGQVYLVQTALVSNAGSMPAGFQFEVDSYSAGEGLSGGALVRVIRSGDVSSASSVSYATTDGTAQAGVDYTSVSGTLNFAPGELSRTITIPITNDNLYEAGNETVNIALSNPTGGAVTSVPSSALITIFDNDSKPIVVTSAMQATEGDSGTKTFAFPVTLTNPSVEVVTVNYSISSGTASAASDFTASSGTLTFPAGTTSQTVNVVVNGDTVVEPNETFSLILSGATNVSFIVGPATGTILNDDATFQLSASVYSVNEQAGSTPITITRIGDSSRVATVNYATSDAAGLASCTLINGKASERCDYATAVGTLRFAPGEVTKSFNLPIVNDALVEGDETFTITLSSPTGATLGGPASATVTIVDNDTTPAAKNPIEGVEFFVTQQYIDFLGRLPDSGGLANWVATLGGCPNGGFGEFDNPNCDRVHVSAGFFLSDEFRGRGYWAYRFYEVAFDRRPAYAEFVPDMARVGGAQSPQSEQLSKASYTDDFVLRTEFVNRYNSLSNEAFLNMLETNAEVPIANKAQLLSDLNGSVKTRAQVLREVVESTAIENRFFVRAFVAMQYFGYLRRDPDTTGYNNWVATLTANPSDYRHMIFGFLYSDEYRGRFGQ